MKDNVPDIHSSAPEVAVPIRAGLEKLIVNTALDIGSECIPMTLSMSAKVGLPTTMRGVHMSRFIKVIEEYFKSESAHRCTSPYDALHNIAVSLLRVHDYSDEAIVALRGEGYSTRNNANFEAFIKTRITRSNDQEWIVIIRTMGSTACPSARAVFDYLEKTGLAPTHMQRAETEVHLVFTERPSIEINEVISTVQRGFSGKLYRYLSRIAEYEVIKKAIETPRFTEDVARITARMLKQLVDRHQTNAKFKVIVKSHESIHPFDIVAESVQDG